jgi:urease accessory protein
VGASATRITREEFVTPPEFDGLQSAFHPAARVGGARIELVRFGDETRLGRTYQQIPVHVPSAFSFDAEPAALLYLVNMTAGLMDGDSHLIDIVARPGTRAVVTGQSASRIHPALSSFASQQWLADVQDGACLVVLPGPNIPFQGARFYQRCRVQLASTAHVLWGDIWLPGRHQRGNLSEKFKFHQIIQDFEVYREDRLIFRDRFGWEGPWTEEEVRWYWGGELACGSLFVTTPSPKVASHCGPELYRSVFPLDTGGTCIRWCGEPNAVTTDLFRTAMKLAAEAIGDAATSPWLLNSTELSPNHWFSSFVPACAGE